MQASAHGCLGTVGNHGFVALKIVAVVGLSGLGVEPGAKQSFGTQEQRPILPEADGGKIAVVAEIEGKPVVELTQPAAIPIKTPVGEDGFPGEIFAKAALPTGPEIVARVVAVEIRISRFLERQRIAGVQDVQRERVLGREIIFNLGGDVVVARIELVVTALHFECEVGVAATGGGQPTSATLRKRALIRSPDAGKA